MKINNEKGISLSITAIVVIAVGLVVMLVVLGYFVGGFGSTGEGMQQVAAGAESSGAAEEIDAGILKSGNLWGEGIGGTCADASDCRIGLVCTTLKCAKPV